MTDEAALRSWGEELLDVLQRQNGQAAGVSYSERPDRIANFDEAGLQKLPEKVQRGVAPKGQRSVHRPGLEGKRSITMVALGTAEGKIWPESCCDPHA